MRSCLLCPSAEAVPVSCRCSVPLGFQSSHLRYCERVVPCVCSLVDHSDRSLPMRDRGSHPADRTSTSEYCIMFNYKDCLIDVNTFLPQLEMTQCASNDSIHISSSICLEEESCAEVQFVLCLPLREGPSDMLTKDLYDVLSEFRRLDCFEVLNVEWRLCLEDALLTDLGQTQGVCVVTHCNDVCFHFLNFFCSF